MQITLFLSRELSGRALRYIHLSVPSSIVQPLAAYIFHPAAFLFANSCPVTQEDPQNTLSAARLPVEWPVIKRSERVNIQLTSCLVLVEEKSRKINVLKLAQTKHFAPL